MSGSIEKGLSEEQKLDKGYQPRTSNKTNQAPNPPKGEKTGKFTIK